MQSPKKPSLGIAIILSLSLFFSLVLLWSGLGIALGLMFGLESFTFGNQFFIQCIVFTIAAAEAVLVGRFIDFKSSTGEELFSLRPTGITEILIAVTAAIALTFPLSEALNGLQAFFPPGEAEVQTTFLAFHPPSAVEKVFVVLSIVAAAPVGEELLYRGAMLSWIRETSRPWVAIVLTSIFFAASHYWAPRWILPILPVGLMLGWLVFRTGSILSSIAAHAAFNGFPLFAYWSGLRIAGYNNDAKEIEHVPLPLWTGGLIILALCLVILEIVARNRSRENDD
jgi:membrane protease YdiL (CAAX protease family)